MIIHPCPERNSYTIITIKGCSNQTRSISPISPLDDKYEVHSDLRLLKNGLNFSHFLTQPRVIGNVQPKFPTESTGTMKLKDVELSSAELITLNARLKCRP